MTAKHQQLDGDVVVMPARQARGAAAGDLSSSRTAACPPAVVPLWDVAALATRLSISPKTVYTMVERGDGPPPIRVGRLLRWDSEAVEAWLAQQTRRR